jgi:hypothetical protein
VGRWHITGKDGTRSEKVTPAPRHGAVSQSAGLHRPVREAAGRRTRGQEPAALLGTGTTLVSLPVGGQPALLGFADRKLVGVLVVTMRGEAIQAVHAIGAPRLLDFLRSQLPAPA